MTPRQTELLNRLYRRHGSPPVLDRSDQVVARALQRTGHLEPHYRDVLRGRPQRRWTLTELGRIVVTDS